MAHFFLRRMARMPLFLGTVHQRQPGNVAAIMVSELKPQRAASCIGGERMFLLF